MQGFITRYYRFLLGGLLFILLALSFSLGKEMGKMEVGNNVILSCSDEVLSALTIPLDTLAQSTKVASVSTSKETVPAKGSYVGSKNGTKYYVPGCASVNRIKPENYVWFENEQDAQLQGYSAGKC